MPTRRRVRIDLLGPLRFVHVHSDVQPPSGRAMELLETLLAHPERRLPADDIAAAIWPGVDAPTGRRRLHLVAARLRRALPDGIGLTIRDGVYALDATTDIDEFDRLVKAAGDGSAVAAQQALDLWRGDAYEGFADTPAVRHARSQLHERRDRLARALGVTHPFTRPVSVTKHRAPFVDGEILRQRLCDRLPRAGHARLVALVAPAGYGKTVALRQWAEYSDAVVARVEVTPELDAAPALCGAIAEAVRTAHGEPTESPASDVWDTPQNGSVNVNVNLNLSLTVNRLLVDARPTAIVLDGVEHVNDPAAVSVLGDIARLVPVHVTIALATRRRLPAPMSRIAAGADSVAVGPDELAFTIDELNEVIERLGGRADERVAEIVHARTGGWPWPAARLAARAVARNNERGRHDPASVVEPPGMAVSFGHRLLDALPEGFLEAVLRGVHPTDRDWLVATAHLAELDADLCEAVTGQPSRPTIERIVAEHQLLDRQDGGTVARQPLQHLLRQRQERDERASRRGHSRASRWFLMNERPAEALDHALAGNDWALIPATAEHAMSAAIETADLGALRRWAPALDRRRDLSGATSVLAHLAASLVPRDERNRLRSAHRKPAAAAMAAADAIDVWSDGRCQDALVRIERTRRLLALGDCPASSAVETTLAAIEGECRLLLDPGIGSEGATVLLRTSTRTAWPWVKLWAHGQLALHAYLADDRALAATLLDRARHDATAVHRSGRAAVGAYATIAESLLTDRHPDGSSSEATDARLRRLADDADHCGRAPISVAAHYARYRLCRINGDVERARSALAEADLRRERLPDLAFLAALRRRCVGKAPGGIHPTASLTDREHTVLRHLDSDMTMRDIADVMFTSVHTVRTHVRSIYRKLGVTRRSDAVASWDVRG